jgi:hypothetical protein
MFDFSHRASSDRGQGLHVHHLVTVTDTPETLHAPVHLRFNQRTEEFLLEDAFGLDKSTGGRGVLMGKILEVAFPALIADRAIQRMISQNKFENMRQFASGLSFGW